MSRPSNASPKPAMGKSKHSGGGGPRGKGLKDIRIDEEVKIAVNISLERFQYSEQKGNIKCSFYSCDEVVIQGDIWIM